MDEVRVHLTVQMNSFAAKSKTRTFFQAKQTPQALIIFDP